MHRPRFAPTADGYDVHDDELGLVGTVRRIIITAASGVQRVEWQPATVAGDPGPVFDTRKPAATWLLLQAAPHIAEPHPPPPDPVTAIIRRYVNQGRPEAAAAAALAAIAQDIDEMRAARARHNPPAIWNHLERFNDWVTAFTAPPAAEPRTRDLSGLPPRLSHLRSVV